jgi:aspartyl-tRNA synthetase
VTEISVEIQKTNPILPYKWLFWWVFNFHFLRDDVKCTKKVHELFTYTTKKKNKKKKKKKKEKKPEKRI